MKEPLSKDAMTTILISAMADLQQSIQQSMNCYCTDSNRCFSCRLADSLTEAKSKGWIFCDVPYPQKKSERPA